MNDFWHMEQHRRQHNQMLMVEAEQSRLAASSRQSQRGATLRVVAPVMFRVGGVLLAWGTRLQAQYGEMSTPATSPKPVTP